MKIFNKIILGSALCLACSCASDFVETTPTDTLPGESIITDQASAESALNGLYSAIQLDYNFSGYDTMLTGLYSDELVHIGSFPSFAEFSVNDPSISNIDNTRYWNNHYAAIYRANLIIKFAEESSVGLNEEATARIVGQARGLRALMYYDLVKAYGGVPLELNAYTSATDIDINPIARSSASEVYAQIVDDVEYAASNIPAGLSRFSFNKNAALVLKAKVEMEMEMYSEAELTLEPLIGAYALEGDYSALYTGTSSASETIFAVDYNETDGSSAAFFYLIAGRGEVAASDILINAFEEGDTRIGQISSSDEVIKYKDAGSGSDDAYVFRYADVLLMYAEVLARQDDPDASLYINKVRERAD